MRSILRSILPMITALVLCAGCGRGNNENKDVVYEDMKAAFEQADLLSANIGLISKTEQDGVVGFGEFGSGVIIKKEEHTYYALTAAHVVSDTDAQLLVFTVNTEMKSEDIPGMVAENILSMEVYDSMLPAETLYVSDRDDLAVVRFTTEDDLQVMELADSDPVKGDRILCIGNPQNDWFAISYGEITSGIEKFGELKNYPSNAMKHSAYIQVGSSGGAAVNEEMKLAGITPGASLSLDGKTFNYGVMIPVSEIRLCLRDMG